MRKPVLVFALGCMAGLTNLAEAGGLFRSLPEDGMRVSYYVTVKVGTEEISRVWTVASVGKVSQDGEPCRWIELVERSPDLKERYRVIKVLVPEKAFKEEGNPVASVQRLWAKQGDANPIRLDSLEDHDPIMTVILDGPTTEVKKLEEKQSLAWQQGQLECDVHTGKNSATVNQVRLNATFRVLSHEKVPFGVAGSTIRLIAVVGDQTVQADIEFALQDFTSGARSELPDLK